MPNLKRDELIEILGGNFCITCGINDSRVLEIDHIFGNGRDMPLTKSSIIDYYLENPDIACEELQVLCANCHRIKTLTDGTKTGRGKSNLVTYEQNYGITVKMTNKQLEKVL